jgi:hypothetical protein
VRSFDVECPLCHVRLVRGPGLIYITPDGAKLQAVCPMCEMEAWLDRVGKNKYALGRFRPNRPSRAKAKR